MNDSGIQVYGYRWVILVLFALINAVVQIHWVTFAPITIETAEFYNVSAMQVGLFAMSYMIVFIFMCVPASYVIDTYGIRIGVGAGALLTGIFGLVKGIFADSFMLVMLAQFGLAFAQPFILNAVTAIGARWFPVQERATAAGLAALSQYLGIIVAMVLTPYLVQNRSMEYMLMTYGVLSVVSAIFFLIFIREQPPLPPSHETEGERISVLAGIGHIFRQRDMLILLVLFFVGLGMFNAVTSWIEQILAPKGLDCEQAGMVGALMMVGGVLGAIILPLMSDHFRRRKAFMIVAMAGALPGLVGLIVADTYTVLLLAGFVLGFFVMAAGPIGFQYGAEISYPAPESTSQGLILWVGQISGIIFMWGMDRFRDSAGTMMPSLMAFAVMFLLVVLVSFQMKESPMMHRNEAG